MHTYTRTRTRTCTFFLFLGQSCVALFKVIFRRLQPPLVFIFAPSLCFKEKLLTFSVKFAIRHKLNGPPAQAVKRFTWIHLFIHPTLFFLCFFPLFLAGLVGGHRHCELLLTIVSCLNWILVHKFRQSAAWSLVPGVWWLTQRHTHEHDSVPAE